MTRAAAIAVMWLVATAQAQNFQRSVFANDVSGAFAVALLDADGDFDLDAVATSMWGSAYLIENVAGERVTSVIWGSVSGMVRGVTAGDLDGDGDTDVVVASYGDDEFVLLENTGESGPNRFVSRTLLDGANGAWSAETGDFDGDGDLDLVVTEYRGNSVKILRNESGEFTLAGAASITEPFSAVFADFDGDGDPDVICGSLVSPLLWIEQGAGGQWTPHSLGIGAGTTSIAAHDLDGDGDLDLTGANYSTGVATWWERTVNGFTAHALSGNLSNPRGLGVADFNGDGHFDIVVTGQYGHIRWWQNDGGGNFTGESLTSGISLYGLTIGDVDADGDPDVVVADYLGSELLLYRNLMIIPAILHGTVRSEREGEPLENVEITVNELGTRAYTDAQGAFRLWTAEGTYTLTARHACWNDALLTEVVLAQTETTTVEFALERGIVNLEITSLNLTAPNREATTARIPLANPGDGELFVSARAYGSYANDEWLTVSPEEASIPADSMLEFLVTITPDTSDNGLWDYFGFIEFRAHACPDSVTDVAVLVTVLDAPDSPREFPEGISLGNAYPNPFNGVTTISLQLPRAIEVTGELFDVSGRRVRRLFEGTFAAGEHRVTVDGAGLGSGVYFARVTTGETRFVRKVMLVR